MVVDGERDRDGFPRAACVGDLIEVDLFNSGEIRDERDKRQFFKDGKGRGEVPSICMVRHRKRLESFEKTLVDGALHEKFGFVDFTDPMCAPRRRRGGGRRSNGAQWGSPLREGVLGPGDILVFVKPEVGTSASRGRDLLTENDKHSRLVIVHRYWTVAAERSRLACASD